jgi:hypothetical protein
MPCNIKCEWVESKRIVVNPDGQVWPCCYLANSAYLHTSLDRPTKYIEKNTLGLEDQLINIEEAAVNTGFQPLMREYFEKQEEYNILNKPIQIILMSEWFAKTLPESWNNEERVLHQCKVHCSK